jgi:sensor histidine kinase regulating citrate/malate metabolism
LKRLLFGSLQRQLIIGTVLSVSIMMSALVWDQTRRQQSALQEQQTEQAFALAQSVATSAAVWVASRDHEGLQEIVDGLSCYPDLRHAIVLDRLGAVLAHSDPTRRGQYLADLPLETAPKVVQAGRNLVDVASPVLLADRHIGWVRVGLGSDTLNAALDKVVQRGIGYGVVAIVLIVFFSVMSGRYLTRRLNAIQQVANAVQSGNTQLRAVLSGTDEAAQLAQHFNSMLDTLAQRERALAESEFRWKFAVEGAGDGVWDWNIQSNETSYSKLLKTMLGYAETDPLPPLRVWQQRVHPDEQARVR